MKQHPDFKLRCMKSSYFTELGTESLMDVVHAYGDPFNPSTMYAHMKRHQTKDLIMAEKAIERKNKAAPPIIDVVESRIDSITEHERGLDEFITVGRNKLSVGELPITANAYLQAIKIKSDIEKNTKDRRMEMIKSFFSGGDKDGQEKTTGPGEQAQSS